MAEFEYVERSENTRLDHFILDLKDTGPDTLVNLRDPRYALALLVYEAGRGNPDHYTKALGETVFAALSPEDTLELDPTPWVIHSFSAGDFRVSSDEPYLGYRHNFEPREGYSQDRSRYREVDDGRG